ncbi:hypothetical protein BKH42_02285 [Helicobacter sp. 13S00482-2]|uniref:hypothetical protein n=1 Tax=Helicobacter sp. 13S00482-2 TaxID=1476200 RepID=UPI000BA4F005|nr:hypothetical protein [Helicobacter sp. 13S00482-2]PAF54061.1 hypothetical protein BKH42_02285 [Helicobacter sp. 13S00482-2]
MKKVILGLTIILISFNLAYCTEESQDTDTQKKAISEKNSEDTHSDLNQTSEENHQKNTSDAKTSKWGYNIWGPMGILKMIDFKDNNQNFAKNGILEVVMMVGPTYEIIKDLKIGANIGIGAQFDINKASYVVPIETNLIYDFNKQYSIFGGLNYSYGGLINDISIYVGTNLKGYSLRLGYIPYAFSNTSSPKLTGSGFYFSFAGLFL